MTLQIELTPEQQQWAADQVAQGMAETPEEAILEAVEIQRIRTKIAKSRESVTAGRVSTLDEAFDRVEKKIKEKYSARS